MHASASESATALDGSIGVRNKKPNLQGAVALGSHLLPFLSHILMCVCVLKTYFFCAQKAHYVVRRGDKREAEQHMCNTIAAFLAPLSVENSLL